MEAIDQGAHRNRNVVKERVQGLTDAARERIVSVGEEKKELLVNRVTTLAGKLEEVSQGSDPGFPEKLTERAAQWLRRVEKTLDGQSIESMVSKFEEHVGTHPKIWLAGSVLLGFLGARMARSK